VGIRVGVVGGRIEGGEEEGRKKVGRDNVWERREGVMTISFWIKKRWESLQGNLRSSIHPCIGQESRADRTTFFPNLAEPTRPLFSL
jgi:hypothetical protein